MPEIINPQMKKDSTATGFKISPRAVLVLLIVIILAAAVIVLVPQKKSDSNSGQSSQADSLKLVAYKYDGSQPGTGMIFQKPEAFKETAASKGKLIKSFDWLSDGHTVGSIHALSASFKDDSERQAVVDGLQVLSQNKPDDQAYQTATQPAILLSRGWIARINSKYVTQLQNVQSFRPATFGNDAWQFPLGASAAKKDNLPSLQGEFIYIIGKNAAYYFGVASTAQKWQEDSATWQQILNSLQIDQ
jgi:hypothetical protein